MGTGSSRGKQLITFDIQNSHIDHFVGFEVLLKRMPRDLNEADRVTIRKVNQFVGTQEGRMSYCNPS